MVETSPRERDGYAIQNCILFHYPSTMPLNLAKHLNNQKLTQSLTSHVVELFFWPLEKCERIEPKRTTGRLKFVATLYL